MTEGRAWPGRLALSANRDETASVIRTDDSGQVHATAGVDGSAQKLGDSWMDGLGTDCESTAIHGIRDQSPSAARLLRVPGSSSRGSSGGSGHG